MSSDVLQAQARESLRRAGEVVLLAPERSSMLPTGGVFSPLRREPGRVDLGPPLVQRIADLEPEPAVALALTERILQDMETLHRQGGAHGALDLDGWGFDDAGYFRVRPVFRGEDLSQAGDLQAIAHCLSGLVSIESLVFSGFTQAPIWFSSINSPRMADARAVRQSLVAMMGRQPIKDALNAFLEKVHGTLPPLARVFDVRPLVSPKLDLRLIERDRATMDARLWIEAERQRMNTERELRRSELLARPDLKAWFDEQQQKAEHARFMKSQAVVAAEAERRKLLERRRAATEALKEAVAVEAQVDDSPLSPRWVQVESPVKIELEAAPPLPPETPQEVSQTKEESEVQEGPVRIHLSIPLESSAETARPEALREGPRLRAATRPAAPAHDPAQDIEAPVADADVPELDISAVDLIEIRQPKLVLHHRPVPPIVMPEAALLPATDNTLPKTRMATEAAPAEVAPVEVAPIAVAQAEVAPIEIAQAEVAPTEVAQAEVAPTEVAQAEVAPTEVAPTEVAPEVPSEPAAIIAENLEIPAPIEEAPHHDETAQQLKAEERRKEAERLHELRLQEEARLKELEDRLRAEEQRRKLFDARVRAAAESRNLSQENTADIARRQFLEASRKASGLIEKPKGEAEPKGEPKGEPKPKGESEPKPKGEPKGESEPKPKGEPKGEGASFPLLEADPITDQDPPMEAERISLPGRPTVSNIPVRIEFLPDPTSEVPITGKWAAAAPPMPLELPPPLRMPDPVLSEPLEAPMPRLVASPEEDWGGTGITGSTNRASEKGPGKWTQSGKSVEDIQAALPPGESRPLALEEDNGNVYIYLFIALVVVLMLIAGVVLFL